MPRHFDDWLAAYMDWTSHSESPDKFHFWTGVSTVAAVLRRRVWIDMRAFKWLPNFYIIFVAPAGVSSKSTSISMGHKLLSKVKGVKFGPNSASWQALLDAFNENVEWVDLGPGTEKYKMSALTLVVSELGTFFRTDEDDYMSFLVSMWDGIDIPVERRTKKDGSTLVENTWLNLIAATTPDWLQANMPETLVNGGLGSRTIFVYADKKRKLVPFPDEVVLDADYYRIQKMLVEDLTEISKLKGPFSMTAEARAYGHVWYEKLNRERPAHLVNTRFNGYLARKQTHLMKLALIFAAAKRDGNTIEVSDLEAADKCLFMVEADMVKVFESIGLSDSAQKLNMILSILKSHPIVELPVMWKTVMSSMSDREFQEALLGGVKAGLLKFHKEGGKTFLAAI